ncbi:hypothetical protein [Nocardia thraciensis]
MSQLLQIAGALLLLSGFIAAQRGLTDDSSVGYLAANAAGSSLLAALAVHGHDWGFLLLEGTWAAVSILSLCTVRPARRGGSDTPPSHGESGLRIGELPPRRAVTVRGDELSRPDRLIHLFRDSYAGSQGRQWLQPYVLWWMLTFLRDNGVRVDLGMLTAPDLAERAAVMALPPGHQQVAPAGHVELNFQLWWSILGDIARVVYDPRRPSARRDVVLPTATELEQRANHLGLRPWMSSSTFEELAGIARALAIVAEHERRPAVVDADEIMLRVLLPGLLVAEMHWLHTPRGRPNHGHHPPADVVLLRRCAQARVRWTDGRYLDALDQLYLRAGDLLDHLTNTPEHQQDSATRTIAYLYRELLRAESPTGKTAIRNGRPAGVGAVAS